MNHNDLAQSNYGSNREVDRIVSDLTAGINIGDLNYPGIEK